MCKVPTQALQAPWHGELPLPCWAVLLLLISHPVMRRGAGLRAWSLVHTYELSKLMKVKHESGCELWTIIKDTLGDRGNV